MAAFFAGCAIVPFGDHTDLAVRSTFGGSHTRPDMAWLMDFVMAAESDAAIQSKAPVDQESADPLRGRPHLTSGANARWKRRKGPTAFPHAQPTRVKLALSLAKSRIDYGSSCDSSSERTIACATPRKGRPASDRVVGADILAHRSEAPPNDGQPCPSRSGSSSRHSGGRDSRKSWRRFSKPPLSGIGFLTTAEHLWIPRPSGGEWIARRMVRRRLPFRWTWRSPSMESWARR